MRHLVWALGFVCAAAVACGGNSEFDDGTPASGGKGGGAGMTGGEGGAPVTGVGLDELPDAYAAALCSVVERCGGVAYDLLTAYEDCKTLTAERLRQGGLDALAAAVDAGRVQYHPELVPACIDAIEARSCADLDQRGIDACEAAVHGTVPQGGTCELNEECEGSLICEIKDACPGTCVERYTAGIPCASDDECADGLVCSQVTSHCVKPAGDGEACGGGVEAQCDAGYLCAGDDKSKKMPGTCVSVDSVTLGAEGDSCDPTALALCKSGLSCVLTGLTGSTLSWQCQAPGGKGAVCGLGLPEDCASGEYCPLTLVDVAAGSFASKCIALPASGERCANRPLGGMPECVAYARCAGDGNCINLRNLGESCDADAVCYSGHCAGGACEPANACK
jgi:hypothetical protein